MVTLYKRFEMKTQRAANQYRSAWKALGVLDPNGSWAVDLLELRDKDIRGPGCEEHEYESNAYFEMSWIWLTPRSKRSATAATDVGFETVGRAGELDESMRAEWAKTRARADRWKEELQLIQEEMRRVVEFFHWKARWWTERASLRSDLDETTMSGIAGYAHKQATLCLMLARACAADWILALREKGITPQWGSTEYLDLFIKPLPPADRRARCWELYTALFSDPAPQSTARDPVFVTVDAGSEHLLPEQRDDHDVDNDVSDNSSSSSEDDDDDDDDEEGLIFDD